MAADEQQNGSRCDDDEQPFFFFDAPSSGFAELVQEERERAVRRQHRDADDEAKQQHRFAFHAPTCENLGADFCGRWSYWSCGRQRGADGQEQGWNHVMRLLIKAASEDRFEYRLLIGEQVDGDNDYPVGCFYRCDGRACRVSSSADVSLWSDSIASYRHPNPPLVLSISQRQPVLTVRLEADGQQLLVLTPFPQQEWAAGCRLERRPCSCHCPDSPTSRFG